MPESYELNMTHSLSFNETTGGRGYSVELITSLNLKTIIPNT